MNERIEHCLYQSGLTAQGCWDELDDYAKQGIEKFAELLVKECIGKVTKVSDSIKEFDPDNVDGIDLCDLITYHIKKHFGVEE